MIRFNIIGTGFLDFSESGGIGFKAENPYFRFADVSLARSTSFSVPATDRNRAMLGFGEDPAEYGDMMRTQHSAQMVYDGGAELGTLAVTAYEGNAFKCVFYIGGAEWISRLQNMKLADCVTSFAKGILWSANNTPIAANAATPSEICQLLTYENGIGGETQAWQLLPSVNILYFLTDIFTNLGVSFVSSLDENYWLIAASLSGGDEDSVTIAVTSTTAATLTQTQDYLEIEDIDIEWARHELLGVLYGGGSTTAKGFTAAEDVEITFPASVTKPLFMIKYASSIKRCEVMGGAYANGSSPYGVEPLDGRTIKVGKGETFFFAETPRIATDSQGTYYGWKDIAYPVSLACTVARQKDLSIGEVWQLRNNMPDMTVFEFLKSVAIATGLELVVDPDEGVILREGSYGTDIESLADVISIDKVGRCVEGWGGNVGFVTIGFDSEDYVTEPIVAKYTIDNENCTDTKEVKSAFSEGMVGSNGILVKDVSDDYELQADKWTIAYADSSSGYLQRVAVPNPVGYDDIANNSTCIRLKVKASEAAFFELTPYKTFTWRGCAYVWTDADWSAGVLSLTLQRVSAQAYYPSAST